MATRRFVSALALVSVGSAASAQIPDVKIKLDAIASIRLDGTRQSRPRFYSRFGHLSTVALTFELEPGLTAYVSQKIERLPNDADSGALDEVYVADEGIWKLGKQYLPFGSGQILRESVNAARADTQLILEEFPIQFAVCDAGRRRQQGVVVRVGTNIGLSLAAGRHFGINGTALTQIREPGDSPGPGRGYRRAIGFDARQRYGVVDVRLETVFLRGGQTAADADRSIFDLTTRIRPSPKSTLEFGLTREVTESLTVLRAVGEFESQDNLALRPFVRLRNGRRWDFGIELRIRL